MGPFTFTQKKLRYLADSAYQGPLQDWTADQLGLRLIVVPKLPKQHKFVVLPKRWIVERTFAWLLKCWRLVRDYEATTSSSMAWIRLAMTGQMPCWSSGRSCAPA